MTTDTDKAAYQAGYQAAQLEASLQAGSPAIPGSAEHWRASYLELSAKFDELLKGRQVLGADSIRLKHENEQLRQALDSTQPPLAADRIDELVEEGVFCCNPHEIVRRIEEEQGLFKTRRLTNVQIKQHAHRICWKYRHSSDPMLGHTYTFNYSTLLQFARAIEEGKHP